MREVVVTGLGCVTSVGVGADAFFDALLQGRSGVVDGIGACAEFEPTDHMTEKEARRTDRFSQLAKASTALAVEDGDWDPATEDPERVGVVFGSGVGGLDTIETNTRTFVERGERRVSPLFVPMIMSNAAAGHIAMDYGVQGPGYSVSSACATGAHAIGDASRMLQHGDVDVCIAGSSEAAITPIGVAAFRRMQALSKEGVSRPFDARRDGFVIGEGAGTLILEERGHAEARGAKIYGRLVGYGASNDAFHITEPEPSGRGAQQAMRRALEDGGVDSKAVSYINAHGTSTPYNDLSETRAIHAVFDGHAGKLAVSSTKSHIGHLLGAAGSVEAVVTLKAIERSAIPPTINYEVPDPECDLDYVPGAPREQEIAVAMSNSFGFGGQNGCLVFAGP